VETADDEEKLLRSTALQTANSILQARLHAEEELLTAKEALEQANKAKDDFLAALSHELRTPLTPVLAILSSLRHEPNLPAGLAADLETIRRNVELEARLIDDLLDLTRITRGKLELHCERVPLGRLVEDAFSTCLPDLKSKGLTLRQEVPEPHLTILADSARVTQILWNLLKNSIKFTPEGGSIRLRAIRGAAPGSVSIEIHDSGIGIEPDQLGKVFDAFEQGNRRITRQFGGLGLGLAISKAIAEAHHGALTATSEGHDRGSTFTLTLPYEGCDESEIPAARDARPTPGPKPPAIVQRPLRILLVEDHADTAAILVRLLSRMGHDVVHAGTVQGGLRLAENAMREAGLDLVISDLGLPDGTGLDLMHELSTAHGLRGIALSGFGMESDLEQSTAAGFARHLIKPIDIALVRQTIEEMMQG
jgi:CheY-like chemotaxis protein